jgi:hypothetical protein
MKTQLTRSSKVHCVGFYVMYYIHICSDSLDLVHMYGFLQKCLFGSKSKSVGSGMYVRIPPEVIFWIQKIFCLMTH